RRSFIAEIADTALTRVATARKVILTDSLFNELFQDVRWWAVRDSNSRHPRCKRGALPTELTARYGRSIAPAGATLKRVRLRLSEYRASPWHGVTLLCCKT